MLSPNKRQQRGGGGEVGVMKARLNQIGPDWTHSVYLEY